MGDSSSESGPTATFRTVLNDGEHEFGCKSSGLERPFFTMGEGLVDTLRRIMAVAPRAGPLERIELSEAGETRFKAELDHLTVATRIPGDIAVQAVWGVPVTRHAYLPDNIARLVYKGGSYQLVQFALPTPSAMFLGGDPARLPG
jgi:hypothetical protein